MTDMRLWHEWDDQLQCNVFTSSVSMHPAYEAMYRSFNPSPADRDGVRKSARYRSQWSVGSDFPMDYFVFYLEQDEADFVTEHAAYIHHTNHTPKAWKRPADPEGHTWCDRCRTMHKVRDPNLPPLEEELAEIMAAEIAREIDEEILQELMAIKWEKPS